MNNGSKDRALMPPNFIAYDDECPSPQFSREDIGYIESIKGFLSEEGQKKCRDVEWFTLNINTGVISCGDIPGLRGDRNFWGSIIGNIYVKRFSSQSYETMMDKFLAPILQDIPFEGRDACVMHPFRVALPNGDKFYPYSVGGDLRAWRRRLQECADTHHTVLGHFERGNFIVSDGGIFGFDTLEVDRIKSRLTPKSW